MMKRVAAAVLMLAAALTVSWASLGYVRQAGDRIAALLEEAEALHCAGEPYAAALDAARQLWEEKHGALGALLKHSDTDEIEKYFYKIKQYTAQGNAEQLFEAVEDCRAAIEVMLRGEDPAARNIF